MAGKRKTPAKKTSQKAVSKKGAVSAKTAKSKTEASSDKPAQAVSSPLVLKAKLGISNVPEMVEELTKCLDTAGPIKVDMSAVNQVDSAAFQVLVGFSNLAMKSEREIQWQGDSEVLKKYSKTLALDSYLEFDSAESSEDELCPVF